MITPVVALPFNAISGRRGCIRITMGRSPRTITA
jgi:hypothetical protein